MMPTPAHAQMQAARLHLPQVTALAVDCLHHRLVGRAAHIMAQQADFGAHGVLSDHAPALPPGCQFHAIRPLNSREAYSAFVLKSLLPYVSTSHVLLYQWDGYTVNPAAWQAEFLDYDYIGAAWWYTDGRNVGNGGFCLRSRKLLLALQQVQLPQTVLFEDDVLCRSGLRDILERDFGIRYAPESLAHRFSFEHHAAALADGLPFGFHGFFNFHRMHADSEVIHVLELGGSRLLQGRDCAMLVCHALREGRLALARYVFQCVLQSGAEAVATFTAHLQGYAPDAGQQLGWLQGHAP